MIINKTVSRRTFLLGAVSTTAVLAGCVSDRDLTPPRPSSPKVAGSPYTVAELNAMYGPVEDGGYTIPAVPYQQIDPMYYRQEVDDPTGEAPGTVVVDTPNKFLYLVLPNGKAMRYGVGIGRAGFSWGGNGIIKWKQEWPKWFPPKEMIARDPKLEVYSEKNGGMPAGLMNPLGARALYIYENGKDTLYRVHGNPEWNSIGKAVSSGCIRMLNQDVIDLYNRVDSLPTPIVVKQ